MIEIEIPRVYQDYLKYNKRYKIAYGGRGSGKTESFARMLIIKSMQGKYRLLCAREVQKSINDSVYQVLIDIINDYGLGPDFDILKTKIINKDTGSEFLFHGLRDMTVDSLKSIKGINYVWVEEGHSVSKNSWEVLIPTIREEDSEIWVTFNRKFRKDPVYELLCKNPDDDTIVKHVNWDQNPFFPKVLEKERLKAKEQDPVRYRHVWEGHPETNLKAIVYYNFNRSQNIVKEPLKYNPSLETWSGFDFGVSDPTSIIVAQIEPDPDAPNGMWINIIDSYENVGLEPEEYGKWMKKREYYNSDMNHAGDPSGSSRTASKGLRSWIKQIDLPIMYKYGYSIEEHVSQANKYMRSIRVCESQCEDVVDMFEQWMYPTDKNGEKVEGSNPKHDNFSHYGTAFYYFIMNRFPIRKSFKIHQ